MQAHNWTIVIVTVETAAKYQYLNWGNEMKFKKKKVKNFNESTSKEPIQNRLLQTLGFPSLSPLWLMTVGHEFHEIFQRVHSDVVGAWPHTAYLVCSALLLQAIGWAPCPNFPSWASGKEIEILDLKSRLSVWLTLDFPGMIPSRIIGYSNPSSLEPLLGKLY